MQNNEGWLTNLNTGVGSQSKITLANHLHHKEKRRLYKTLAYILRIGICIYKTKNINGSFLWITAVLDIIMKIQLFRIKQTCGRKS